MSAIGGDIAEVTSQMEMLKILECPVCQETMFPPIYSCTAGHTICHVCLKQLKNCPVCKNKFSTSRNYSVESIVNSSKFHCEFKEKGCNELIRGEVFKTHIKNCKFGKPIEPQPKSESFHIPRSAGCCQWIKWSKGDGIPRNAVEGGIEDGARLYIGRAGLFGGLVPGKLHATRRTLSVPWEGKEYTKFECEILIAAPDTLTWVSSTDGSIPNHAVIGGRTDIGEALYIGRCGYKGTLAVGRILPSKKICRIIYEGQESCHTNYEVLIKNALGIQMDLESSRD